MSNRFVHMVMVLVLALVALAPAMRVSSEWATQATPGGIRSIAQFDPSQGVYVAAADGSGSTRIVDGGHDPAPSPDGSLIAYATFGPDGTGIMVTGWDGSGTREVISLRAIPLMPSWSPDGNRIAYLTYSESYDLVLSVVNLDGSGLTQLAQGTQSYPSRPAWSPDGRQIAYVGPGSGGSDLWLVNLDSTGAIQLADLPGETEAPAFSPDGSLIAFDEQVNEGQRASGLYIVRPDGSGLTALTQWTAQQDPSPTNISSDNPAWSPDGSRLAFASIQGIAIANADGSGVTIIDLGDFPDLYDPAWSPDGTQLAMSYDSEFGDAPLDPDAAPSTGEYEDIYVMNVVGSGLTPVGATALVDLRPLWSPDGTRIVFSNESPGN